MIVKLLTEHHLEFLSLEEGSRDSPLFVLEELKFRAKEFYR